MIEKNVLLVFLRFENQGQDNGQEYKEGTKAEANIIWTEEISKMDMSITKSQTDANLIMLLPNFAAV